MVLLNIHGGPYFLWRDVYLSSQNCQKACGVMHSSPQHILEISDEVEFIDNKLYQEIIGSLIYIMIPTRPDICYTVIRLFQDLVKPNSIHLMKAKHASHYLKRHNQSVTNN